MDSPQAAPKTRLALELALRTAPGTSWEARLVYDHGKQLYSPATMRAQFQEMADRARARIMSAPGQWARTGRWPRLRNADAFFLRLAILWALGGYGSGGSPGNTAESLAGPPWKEAAAVWLEAATVDSFFEGGLSCWLDQEVSRFFEEQEDAARHWRAYD